MIVCYPLQERKWHFARESRNPVQHAAAGKSVRDDTPSVGLPTSLSLLAGLRVQDREAGRAFVTLYTPLVVRWCHRQSLREADVSDVSQEVFRCVIQDLPSFRKEAATDTFRGWLCRITHRRIADFFRTRARVVPAEGGT